MNPVTHATPAPDAKTRQADEFPPEASLVPDSLAGPEPEKSDRPKPLAAESTDPTRSPRRRSKVGGVAPVAKPPGRWARWKTSGQLARRGFVPLTPGQPKVYQRILPRTVIGISAMLMSAGIGAAFSGAAFYAYYDDRLAQNEEQVATFVDGFETQFNDASGAIDSMRVESVEQIRRELGPLAGYVADSNGIVALPDLVGESVWTVSTTSESGEPAVGSAFAIAGHNGGTALITSYSLVRAATIEPAPTVTLIKGEEELPVTVWSWDADRDLAIIVVQAEIPRLKLADLATRENSTGVRLFVIGGVGGQGATASPGFLVDQSNLGIQHTVPVGTLFEGGPLVNSAGLVIGVATPGYRPFGVDGGAVSMSVDVSMVCERLLDCADEANTVTVEVPDDSEDG